MTRRRITYRILPGGRRVADLRSEDVTPAMEAVDLERAIPAILADVGDDAQRARATLDAELARDGGRTTLIDALRRIAE